MSPMWRPSALTHSFGFFAAASRIIALTLFFTLGFPSFVGGASPHLAALTLSANESRLQTPKEISCNVNYLPGKGYGLLLTLRFHNKLGQKLTLKTTGVTLRGG